MLVGERLRLVMPERRPLTRLRHDARGLAAVRFKQ